MTRLRERVDRAMDVPTSYERFNGEIQNPHNTVHVRLGCVMAQVITAAYDPVFWMHHGFVDKVFAQWQIGDTINHEKHRSFIELTRGLVLEPFNNRSHNDFHEITNKPNSETWDYQKNLGFEYDTLEWSDDRQQSCRQVILEDVGNQDLNWNVVCQNETRTRSLNLLRRAKSTGRLRHYTSEGEVVVPTLEVRIYAAFDVPMVFGGAIQYQFCEEHDGLNSCSNGTLNAFGGTSPPPNGTAVSLEDCMIQTDLQLDRLVVSNTIPSSTPNEMKWDNIVIEEQARVIIPKPAFVVYIIEVKGLDDLKIAHLPKGAQKSDYGNLLEGYVVKEYCDTIKVAHETDENDFLQDETWQLGQNCN